MHPDTRLSSRFTLAELIRSETAEAQGIENLPPPEVVENLRRLAEGLEQVERMLRHPLEISSGYRCPALNEAVGGTAGSQHCRGEAADFSCEAFGPPLEIARAIAASDLAFDQCILEYGRWVHLSFSAAPRRRILTIYADGQGYRDGVMTEAGERVA